MIISFYHHYHRNKRRLSTRGFTLVELILVMVLMVVVASLVAPSMSSFFRGRSLDSEARRFISLTRFAQNRAVSEGGPMVLWVDAEQRAYGLIQEATYAEVDAKPITYELAEDVEIQTGFIPVVVRQLSIPKTYNGIQPSVEAVVIRFLPDGFIAEGSPQDLWMNEKPRQGAAPVKNSGIWITQTRGGGMYEIQTNNIATVRR